MWQWSDLKVTYHKILFLICKPCLGDFCKQWQIATMVVDGLLDEVSLTQLRCLLVCDVTCLVIQQCFNMDLYLSRDGILNCVKHQWNEWIDSNEIKHSDDHVPVILNQEGKRLWNCQLLFHWQVNQSSGWIWNDCLSNVSHGPQSKDTWQQQ